MSESLTIVLPLPRKALHPNARCHYMAKARAKSEDRHDAAIAATAAMNKAKLSPPRWAVADVEVEYRFYRNSPRDPDNLVAWYKSFLDGIVDAGVLIGDSTITLPPVRQVTGHKNQCVVFTVRPKQRTTTLAGDHGQLDHAPIARPTLPK